MDAKNRAARHIAPFLSRWSLRLGLIHAAFEDWMFAPGSYLCVFFWVAAFLLIDFVSPGKATVPIRVSPSASFAAPALRRFPTSV